MSNADQFNDDPDKEQAWKEIVYDYCPGIIRIIARRIGDWEAARDLIYGCVGKVYKRYRDKKIEKLKDYLFIAIRNAVLNYETTRKRRKDRLRHVPLPPSFNHETHDTLKGEFTKKPYLKKVADALEQLPEQQQKVIYYYYLEDRSYKEIASLMDLAYPTVVTHHKKGLANLRQLLGPDFPVNLSDDDH